MKIEDFEESEPTERIPLRVRFESMEEVESAYRTDISRGGFFVADLGATPSARVR